MPFASSLQAFRSLRIIDGIFYWLLFTGILVFARLAFDLTGTLRYVMLLPVAGLTWNALLIPHNLLPSKEWSLAVTRLKPSVLLFAGCSPMVIFWGRNPENYYLYINTLLCAFGAMMGMLQMCSLLRELCIAAEAQGLAWETRLTYHLVFWISLVGTWGTVSFLTVIGAFIAEAQPIDMLKGLYNLQFLPTGDIPIPARTLWVLGILFIATPFIFFFSVTFRTRLVLHFRIKELLKGQNP